MRLFKITDDITVVCEWKKTRTAFKHEARLFIHNVEVAKAKICYQNRTWERYEYESVLWDVLYKAQKETGLSKESIKLAVDSFA